MIATVILHGGVNHRHLGSARVPVSIASARFSPPAVGDWPDLEKIARSLDGLFGTTSVYAKAYKGRIEQAKEYQLYNRSANVVCF